MYVVYALIDPRDNTVHYVGMTNDVYKRFLDHIQCGGGNFIKSVWILELRKANQMVIMKTLEETETRWQALEREAYWIKHFEGLKEPLANISKTSSIRRAKRANLKHGRGAARKIMTDLPPVKVMRAAMTQGPTEQDKERIKTLFQSGMPRRQICKALGRGNWYYNIVRQVLNEEGL